MKTRTLLASLALTGAVLLPQAATAQEPRRWYVAASGTASFVEDADATVANVPAPGLSIQIQNDVKPGPGVQVALGRRFGRLRLEGEIGYTRNTQDDYVSPPAGRIPADVKQEALRGMVNAYFDFAEGPIQPYVGAGIGVARVDLHFVAARAPFPTETPRTLIDGSDTGFAYQLMGGVAVPLGERTRLTAQYRWFDAGTAEFRDLRNLPTPRDHAGHNIDVGLRLSF